MDFLISLNLHMEYPTLIKKTSDCDNIVDTEGENMTPELEPAHSTVENPKSSRYSTNLGCKLNFLKLSNFQNERALIVVL